MYNGERGPSLKYSFYIYYPLHLLILANFMVVPLIGIGVVTDVNRRAAVMPVNNFSNTPVERAEGTVDLVNAIIQDVGPSGTITHALL